MNKYTIRDFDTPLSIIETEENHYIYRTYE